MRADGDSKKFVATLKVWLAVRPDVDRVGPDGETAMYNAGLKCGPGGRYLEIIKLFVTAGASCNVTPKGEPHLLDIAVDSDTEAFAVKMITALLPCKPSKPALAAARKRAEAKGWKRLTKLLGGST
jgi:hypothetical protein